MKMKTNLLALSCLAIAVSCNSDSNPNNSSGEVSSQENQSVSSNNLNKAADTLKTEVSKFEKIAPARGNNTPTLSINPEYQIDEDHAEQWWTDANFWKLRDPKITCTGDFSNCNEAIISTRNFLANDLDKSSSTNSIRTMKYPTELLCVIGNGVGDRNYTDNKLNLGTYEVTLSQPLQTKCTTTMAVGTKITVNSLDLLNASQYYDSKLALKIMSPGDEARDALLFVRDSQSATNIAITRTLAGKKEKSFIIYNKEYNLFRAESFETSDNFSGAPTQGQSAELTRLYRNANGLAIIFSSRDDSLHPHGREVFSYALKGNVEYPELNSQVTAALSNYREVTDMKMACLGKATGEISACTVDAEITYWNAQQQVEKIYGEFKSEENMEIHENSFINFLSETEVVSAQTSTN